MFTTRERESLTSQMLTRLATVSRTGQPDADVVGFKLDGDEILIGSRMNFASSRKYKNITAGGVNVSLVVDMLAAVEPMTPVAVKIHGKASIEQRNGHYGPGEYIVVRPTTTWSWGIEGPAFVDGKFRPHKTVWPRPQTATPLPSDRHARKAGVYSK